jgi:predicted nucleic-acid-binding Zn-ribbon protein
MRESEVKKCPKCGGTMTPGILSITVLLGWEINWRKKVRRLGEKIVAFRCTACGYVELYSAAPKERVKS